MIFMRFPQLNMPCHYRWIPENTGLILTQYPIACYLQHARSYKAFPDVLQDMFLAPRYSLSNKLSGAHCHGAVSAQKMLPQHIANHLKHRTTVTTHSLAFFGPPMSEGIITREQGGTRIPSLNRKSFKIKIPTRQAGQQEICQAPS